MRRLERLVAIALFLGVRRRVRASDVAEHFGVSLRTVYRDVRALAEAGFPVEGSAGDGYRLPQESYLRPLALTPQEAEVLTVAARALGASVSADMRESLARATSKLEASLDAPTRRQAAGIHLWPGAADGDADGRAGAWDWLPTVSDQAPRAPFESAPRARTAWGGTRARSRARAGGA